MERKRVLIYSPFAYIWAHSLPEIQLGKVLRRNNFEVAFLGCKGEFHEFCTSMSAAGLTISSPVEDKLKVCSSCIKRRRLTKAFTFFDFLEYREEDLNQDKFDIPNKFSEQIEFEIDGIALGRLALYETLITYKKSDLNLSQVEQSHYAIALKNAAKTFQISNKILLNFKPHHIICYSPQYVIPGILSAVAKKMNIDVSFIEGSPNDVQRYSHLRIWNWETYGLTQPGLSNIELFNSYNPSQKALNQVEHFLNKKSEQSTLSVYSSSPKGLNPYTFFGLDPNKKLFLLCISSYDEVFSGYVIGKLPKERMYGRVFLNQIEWLRDTVDWFAERPHLQLVIRPHPREFPNKRENIQASYEKIWGNILTNLPQNVKLDHPSIKFSLYDYFDHIQAVITGWSSAALEALAQGIPVVTYDEKLPPFPNNIHFTGNTIDQYHDNLALAAESVRSEINSMNAMKWLAYTFEVGTVKIGGRLSDKLRLDKTSALAQKLNYTKVLNVLVKILEINLKVSKSGEEKIVRVVNGQKSSLF